MQYPQVDNIFPTFPFFSHAKLLCCLTFEDFEHCEGRTISMYNVMCCQIYCFLTVVVK